MMIVRTTCRPSRPVAMRAALSLAFALGLAAPLHASSVTDAPSKPAPAAKKKMKELKPRHVDAAGAEKLLKSDPKVVVLDVRTPGEFADGHLDGAKNLDFNAPNFAAELEKLDRSKTYLVHCAAGGRSTRSLEAFKKAGFESVVHLDGGFNGWTKAGKPVKK